ncbi:MAG: Ger(x)C family spore germination protein [Peptococcaceae bacterium]|nr:Ger(x)C family spore germination protein [Peptococcaceae bacterium]
MRGAKIFFSLVVPLILAGCWGSRETDEIAYVLAMGFDKGPGKNIIVTFQIANPKSIAGTATGGGTGGGGAAARPLLNISTIAPLPIGAFNLVNTERGREISLLHATAYVFSEELAREGLHDYIVPLQRYRETRGTAYVFVCRGKARDFLDKNQPVLELSPSKQYELLTKVNRLHALSPVVRFHDFYNSIISPAKEAVAPLVAVGAGLETGRPPGPGKLGDYLAGDLPSNKGEPQFIGAAVFRRDKMVGTLTGDETRYLNMITGNMDRGFLIVDDPLAPGKPLGLTLIQARRPTVRVGLNEETPALKVDLYLEPEIVGVSSDINYEDPRLKTVLEKELAELVESRCRELITRTQQEFRSDIFGFGRHARTKFLTRDRWMEFRWDEAYPLARADINVHVKIRRTGLILKPHKVHR